MNAHELINAIETLAPPQLAEEWDNTGLLVGDPSWTVDGPVFLTIDLTDVVLDEALTNNAGAIVAYHPPIFKKISRITPSTREGRTVLACSERRVCLYSPHTALDAAPDGLAEWLVRLVGTGGEVTPITPSVRTDPSQTHKIVTFVPEEPPETLDRVRNAMADAGAGRIGGYTDCSFAIPGTGSFKGGETTNPTVGEKGTLESVRETRLEMVASARALPSVIRALYEAHPYEEPAYDLFKMEDRPDVRKGAFVGAGRIMDLDKPATPQEIAKRVKDALGIDAIKLAYAGGEPITRVAACPGAGGSLLDGAISQGAQLFLTGETRHHDALAALEQGCSVLLAGHTNTERPYLPTLASRLGELLDGAEFVVSERDAAPFENVVG